MPSDLSCLKCIPRPHKAAMKTMGRPQFARIADAEYETEHQVHDATVVKSLRLVSS